MVRLELGTGAAPVEEADAKLDAAADEGAVAPTEGRKGNDGGTGLGTAAANAARSGSVHRTHGGRLSGGQRAVEREDKKHPKQAFAQLYK